jgi:TP901 family phage tail tape measure protein
MVTVGRSASTYLTLPLIGVGIAAVRMAADLGQAMANVNSIMKLPQAQLARLTEQVLELSTKLPQTAKTLAEGLYSVASAGYKGQQAMKVLTAAARAASAGLTDTETAAMAIVFALKAYGMSAGKARAVSDILFKAVDKGILSFEQLASSMGDWVGAAAQIGVPLKDATAALAAMTLAGVPAAEASTSLARIFTSLAKPTKDLSKLLKEWGFSSGFAALQTLGLQGIIEKLSDHVGKNKQKWFELLGEQRAVRGAFALTANDGKNLNEVMEAMKHRAGATGAALKEQAKGPTFQFQVAINNLRKSLIDLGNTIIPVITRDVIPAIQKGVKWFDNLSDSQKSLIIKVLALAAVLGPASMLVGGLIRLVSLPIRIAGSIARLVAALVASTAAHTAEAAAVTRSATAYTLYIANSSGAVVATSRVTAATTAATVATGGLARALGLLGVAVAVGIGFMNAWEKDTQQATSMQGQLTDALRRGVVTSKDVQAALAGNADAQKKVGAAIGASLAGLNGLNPAWHQFVRVAGDALKQSRKTNPELQVTAASFGAIAGMARTAASSVAAYLANLRALSETKVPIFGRPDRREEGGIVRAATGLITRGPTILAGEGNYPTFAGKGAEMITPLDSRGIGIMARAFEMAMQRAGKKGGADTPEVYVKVMLSDRQLELLVERIVVDINSRAERAVGAEI